VGTANLQFRCTLIAKGGRHKHEILPPLLNPQAILQAIIFPRQAHRVTVTIGTAATDPREIELKQQRVNDRGLTALYLPAKPTIGYLLQDQQLIPMITHGGGDRN